MQDRTGGGAGQYHGGRLNTERHGIKWWHAAADCPAPGVVKRNVAGAVNAVSAAQLSLAGIKSAIPVDEVIDAMRRIGNEMSPNIKETGQGGLATTPTAIQIGKSL